MTDLPEFLSQLESRLAELTQQREHALPHEREFLRGCQHELERVIELAREEIHNEGATHNL